MKKVLLVLVGLALVGMIAYRVMDKRSEPHALTGNASDLPSLPRAALISDNESTTVFLLEGDIVRQRRVVPGLEDGDYVAIREGLSIGDQVVSSGQTLVTDGARVIVKSEHRQTVN